jgi:uncharacterized DUF497 family protein
MVGLSAAERFEWDDGNARKHEEKHGVTQQEAEQVFLNEPLLLLDDAEHSRLEPRFHAYGHTEAERRLQVSFALRDEGRAIRVISTRPMSKKEKERYEAEV